MSVAVVTGSCGLIGSEAALHFGSLGLDVVGIDNDMRRVFFGADGSTAWNREPPAGAPRAGATPPRRSTSATATAMLRLFARYGRGHRARRSTPPRSRRTTGRRASPSPTSTSTPSARSTCSRPRGCTLPRRPFIFTLDQQGLRRPAERAAARRARDPLRDRPGHTYYERHPRGHVDRRLPAQPLRRLEGRRRRDGAGVRPLLRHADGVLPGRHADRPGPLGRRSCTGSSPT